MNRRFSIPLLAFLALAFPPLAPAQTTAPAPKSIIVVSDDNYPPYVFRDSSGALRGILPDQWALWEKKTGVKVDLQAMDWAKAQDIMQAGRANVIDTIFRTPEREQLYDFAPPYADIKVPIYAHESLGGINGLDALQGFTVGVKSGDSVIEHLVASGITSLREYPSYEAIIAAAESNEIKVFSIDEPAAIYHLYKHNIADEFRTSFILYTGAFHRAVHKGNADLLKLVQDGFNRISPSEYNNISEKWMGTPVAWTYLMRRFALALLSVVALFVLLAVVNLVLQARIRRRTAELRNSQARLENILQLAPVGIGIFFRRDLVDANETLAQMLGYTRPELLGLSIEKLYGDPQEFHRAASEFYAQIEGHGQSSIEITMQRKDGPRIPVLARGALLDPQNPDGEIIFTALDLTERNRAEEDRLNYTSRLQEAQRIESLGVLAGGIAHDFNNLLTAILGNIDLALLDLPRDNPARSNLATAIHATHRAADLAQQMLAYSGKGHFVIEPINVASEIRATAQLLQSTISMQADLRIHVPDALPAIEADASQFRQVVMNLVMNASEALEKQPGTIAITAGTIEGDTQDSAQLIPHTPLEPAPYVFVEVADTGAGIRPEFLDKIFDPFFSTKFTGRGLGLAAVLGIVRGHHGAIRVESVLGRGTSFRVFFPASSAPAPVPAVPAGPSEKPIPISGTILLVDDESGLRDTASKLLSRLGCQVLCAADGEQALRIFRARSAQIDGVILDLAMPRMDGVQALEELRKIRPDIPVLISSGYAEIDVMRRFETLKPNGFIQKPYTLDSLRGAVVQLWGE